MAEVIDVHKVFANYFPGIEPWAYAASQALEEGSICLDLDTYLSEINTGIKAPYLRENDVLDDESLLNSEFVTEKPEVELKPFILKNRKFYMQRYYEYQIRILKKIKALIQVEKESLQSRIEWLDSNRDLIQEIFKNENQSNDNSLDEIETIDWQKVAALNSCLHNFSIITGGPGTGKTTTVSKILAIMYLQNPKLKVALAAPTGKAAVRLGESISKSIVKIPGLSQDIKDKLSSAKPRTIHRLLESLPVSSLFRHNEDNPLGYDLVIIDEASMIDGALMFKLLDSIRPENRIILIGDQNQLASVEAGSIFGDLCRTQGDSMNYLTGERLNFCNKFMDQKIRKDLVKEHPARNILSEHIIQLYRNYRTESRDIFSMCKLIVQDKQQELTGFLKSREFRGLPDESPVTFDQEYNSDVIKEMILKYRDFINSDAISEALSLAGKFRVLCAVREGVHGIYNVNKNIEQILKNEINNPLLFNPAGPLYHNQLIMVTTNNYDLDIFNGDTGIVRRRSGNDNTLVAWFEGPKGVKEILPGYIRDFETAFALTIHKSQGSEFESVAVILPENENIRILTRELLYTGVSRAKEKVLIQSHEDVLGKMISRHVSRASGINDQL